MTIFYLDEHKSRTYLVVATRIEDKDIAAARRAVRSLRMKGQNRIHFTKESDRRRREILAGLTRPGFTSYVYKSRAKHQAEARAQCLAAVVSDLRELRVTEMVLERDETVQRADRQLLFSELRAHGLGGVP